MGDGAMRSPAGSKIEIIAVRHEPSMLLALARGGWRRFRYICRRLRATSHLAWDHLSPRNQAGWCESAHASDFRDGIEGKMGGKEKTKKRSRVEGPEIKVTL